MSIFFRILFGFQCTISIYGWCSKDYLLADAPGKIEVFLMEHPEVIFIDSLMTPEGLEIKREEEGMAKVIATKAYHKGERIYENYTFYFPDTRRIIVKDKGQLIEIKNEIHTVFRSKGLREFFYFDSFMNHSCSPNTLTQYITPLSYEGIALKEIAPGDELTCDYMLFDSCPQGEGFNCRCGSENCRKVIR